MSRSNFRSLRIHPDEIDLFAACFAQIAYQMDENIDEVEAFDITSELLHRRGELNYMDAVELGIMFKTTKFNAKRGIWN